jgi:DNA-binding response OmpR family regulator
VHPKVLHFDDLHVDLEAHIAQRAGRNLDLSKLEYDLLVALMRRPRRVFTREELLDDVWGVDSDAGTGAVERYISYLRDKVDEGYSKRLIHTVRGVGYTIRD